MEEAKATGGQSPSAPTVRVLGTTMIGTTAPTPRQRAIVAALALAGSEGMGVEQLADAVWAGYPPRSARSSLQNQMTRLRRRHGDDLVVCEGSAYRLCRATDAERFEATILAARESTPSSVVTALTDALALWRDCPYRDLPDHHGADIERARLGELRAEAVERLAVGRIDVGDLDRCANDLRVALEHDPYRDRLWELLFISLDRAGRRVEAVAAHDLYVRRLRSELGAEPPPRLVAIGQALSGSQPLDPASTARPALVVPPATCARAVDEPARLRRSIRCRTRAGRS